MPKDENEEVYSVTKSKPEARMPGVGLPGSVCWQWQSHKIASASAFPAKSLSHSD